MVYRGTVAMFHTIVIVLLLVAVIAVVLGLTYLQSIAGKGKSSQFVSKAPLSPNEQEFFWRLNEALPEHPVLAQVALGALVTAKAQPGIKGSWRSAQNQIDKKIVDFVILDDDLRVIALVELDDRTHTASKDAARDAMTQSAGYVTLRYDSRAKPAPAKIRADVYQLIAAKAAPKTKGR